MERLEEFDAIVTPESWIDSVLQYQNSELRLGDMRHANIVDMKSRKHNIKSLRIMAIVAIIVVLSCTSVFAYGVIRGYYDLKPLSQFRGILSSASEDKIQSMKGLTKTDGGLKVTCTKVIAQDTKICFQIEVQTEDGSSLYENTESRWSVLGWQGFSEADLMVDEKICNEVTSFSQRRTDDGGVAQKATFEVNFTTKTSMVGKNLSLTLSGYEDGCIELLDIGATYHTLEDLFGDVKMADESEFIQCESEQQANSCYQPERGNLHIQFSENYPNSYIDNVGIYSCGINKKETEGFYIGITMGSFDDYEVLKRLMVINCNSGEHPSLNVSEAYRLSWDRVVLLLIPSADTDMTEKYADDALDFTKEMLSEYTLGCLNSKQSGTSIKYHGTWKFDMQLDESKLGTTKKAEDINIQVEAGNIHIDSLEVKDMDIKINGNCNFKLTDYGRSEELYLTLVMSDGSTQNLLSPPSSMFGDSNERFEVTWDLKKIIDASNVKEVQWWGNTIVLQ